MHTISIQKSGYIDALRAYAIMSVILLHVSQWVSPSSGIFQGISRVGNYGVQLFFITSALTLFLSLDVRYGRESHAIAAFFIRRFFRIAPLFYVAMVAYQLYSMAAYEPIVPRESPWWHFIVTVLFLHGWHPSTMNTLVPGCWSIAVEMTFYLCLPVLFLFLTNRKRTLYFLFATIVASKALSYLMAVILEWFFVSPGTASGNFLYYWFFSQLPVFILGIGLYHEIKRIRDRGEKVFGAFLIVVSIFLYFTFVNYTCWGNLLPQHLVYSVIFCVFAAGLHWYPMVLFVNIFTRGIGRISYSLYLSHFLVLDVLKKAFKGDFPIQGDPGWVCAFVAVLALSVTISLLTYFIIEKPGIKLGNSIIAKLC